MKIFKFQTAHKILVSPEEIKLHEDKKNSEMKINK
jgi:hypothetical protein